MLLTELGSALKDALGGSLKQAHLDRLSGLVPLPELALDKELFILAAAFAERLFCYGEYCIGIRKANIHFLIWNLNYLSLCITKKVCKNILSCIYF